MSDMKDCTTCPHVIGDSDERDCGFPDCMGGWEAAYKNLAQKDLDEILRLRAKVQRLHDENKHLREACGE